MSDYENTMSFQLRAQNTLAKPDSHATKFLSYSHAPNRRFNQTKERERERDYILIITGFAHSILNMSNLWVLQNAIFLLCNFN